MEGDISAVQLTQNLMKLGEGKIPNKPSRDLMKLADRLYHIVTRERGLKNWVSPFLQ